MITAPGRKATVTKTRLKDLNEEQMEICSNDRDPTQLQHDSSVDSGRWKQLDFTFSKEQPNQGATLAMRTI